MMNSEIVHVGTLDWLIILKSYMLLAHCFTVKAESQTVIFSCCFIVVGMVEWQGFSYHYVSIVVFEWCDGGIVLVSSWP